MKSNLPIILRATGADLRRGLLSFPFYLTVALLFLSVWVGVFARPELLREPGVTWAILFYEGVSGMSTIFPMALAAFCALPNATQHMQDIQRGVLLLYLIRQGNKGYLWSKLLSVALLTGFAVLSALLLFLAILLCFFPGAQPSALRAPLFLYSGLFWNAPILYCLMLIGHSILFGMGYALAGMALSCYVPKKATPLVAPFLVAIVLTFALTGLGGPSAEPFSLIMIGNSRDLKWPVLYGEIASVIALSSLLFALGMKRGTVL